MSLSTNGSGSPQATKGFRRLMLVRGAPGLLAVLAAMATIFGTIIAITGPPPNPLSAPTAEPTPTRAATYTPTPEPTATVPSECGVLTIRKPIPVGGIFYAYENPELEGDYSGIPPGTEVWFGVQRTDPDAGYDMFGPAILNGDGTYEANITLGLGEFANIGQKFRVKAAAVPLAVSETWSDELDAQGGPNRVLPPKSAAILSSLGVCFADEFDFVLAAPPGGDGPAPTATPTATPEIK